MRQRLPRLTRSQGRPWQWCRPRLTVAPRRSVLGATRTSASYSRFVVSLTLTSREGNYVYRTVLEYIGISTSKYFYVKESKINRVAYRHLASSPYLVVLVNYLRTGLKLITPASLVISSVSAGPASWALNRARSTGAKCASDVALTATRGGVGR